MNFGIRHMKESDIDAIARAFAHWGKLREQYARYWDENLSSERVTIVAVCDEKIIGYGNVVWKSEYEPFCDAQIPEIHDLNVVEAYQKQGVGTALIREAENIARERGCKVMGIGVEISEAYRVAQTLYPKLGYIPDGRGVNHTPWGDDLHLMKKLI